ncbi:MAG: TrkH family potassium uptake protein [Clostridia bacterium]|nr:TrkH family potassium uptake protein [Clostridia bacterium]
MNFKMVFNTIGKVCNIEAILMILPVITCLIYREWSSLFAFLITMAILLALGTFLTLCLRPKDHIIFAKEGFTIVALVWLLVSAFGALPFVISGFIPSFVDAFFETVSGFTTTGASILDDVEALSHGMLFWRSFTHFIGGMGFLVFVMAVIPNLSDRSIHIMRAEMPGPVVGKIVPKAKDTAKILYLIYIVMTALEFVLLALGNMPIFDSIVLSFGTAGTGGFGIKADSIASYSPYCQWVIAVFMILFGINFNLYYLLLIKRFKPVFKSSELHCYFAVIAVASAAIAINTFKTLSLSIRESVFQVASIITTTGYSTVDFDKWPVLSKSVILVLMMLGACAGSTGGGLKVSRAAILIKTARREFKKLIHPHAINNVRFEDKTVEEETTAGIATYFGLYMVCILAVFLLISFEPFDIETNLSAAISCFNNIGPGLAKVGPSMSYSAYSNFTKLVLSAAMLLGRLEIYPLIIAFTPSTWLRK